MPLSCSWSDPRARTSRTPTAWRPWALLTERLDTAASFCQEVGGDCSPAVAERLAPVATALRQIANILAEHLPAGRSHLRDAAVPGKLDRAGLDALLGRAADLATAAGVDVAAGEAGQLVVPRLVDSVLRPLADAVRLPAGAMTGQPPAGRAAGRPERAADQRQAGSEPSLSDLVWEAAQAATRLRVRAGQTGTAAPELAEATAALQSLACELAPASERADRNAELWRLQHDVPTGIMKARNGPYLATDIRRLRNYLGEQIPVPPQVALTGCHASSWPPPAGSAMPVTKSSSIR